MKFKDVNKLTTKELVMAIRIGLKANQTEVAKLIGTNQSTISRWENGTMEPGLIEKQALKDLYSKLPNSKKYLEENELGEI